MVSDFTLPAIMFVLFAGLRIWGVTDWSWWWVTSPLWIAVLYIVFSVAYLIQRERRDPQGALRRQAERLARKTK